MTRQPIKPFSAKLAFILLAIIVIVSSMTFLGKEILDLVPAITMIFIGFIMLSEVGLKKFTNMSRLKNLGAMEMVTLIIGIIVLFSGFLALPFVPVEIEILAKMAGTIGIIAGIVIFIQALY